jgi:hypothetical protein
MDYQIEIAKIEAKIKQLTKQRDALRAEAVEAGVAQWVETARTYTPNLDWWKEQHPKTWQRYMRTGTAKNFTWL